MLDHLQAQLKQKTHPIKYCTATWSFKCNTVGTDYSILNGLLSTQDKHPISLLMKARYFCSILNYILIFFITMLFVVSRYIGPCYERKKLYIIIYKSGCDSKYLDKLITCHKPQYMPLHSLHSDWTNKLSWQKIGTSASGSINYTVRRVSQQPVQFQKWRVLWPQMLLSTLFNSLFDTMCVSLYVKFVGYPVSG